MQDTPDTTPAKIAANRRNAALSTGPKDIAATRLNAVQHGMLAHGITELDDPGVYEQRLAALRAEYAPQGTMENYLVERLALCSLRVQRAAMLEAEAITAVLHPPTEIEVGINFVTDPGIPARVNVEAAQRLCDVFQRYETCNENKLYRAMHQLERIQRIRKGEPVAPPAALDVGVTVASFGKEDVEKE